jgi:carbohydrate binding protein with CBM4/9 domain
MRTWLGVALAMVMASAGARLAGAAGAAVELVRGGSFEQEGAPGFGRGWASESYGNAKIQFDRVQEKAQAGQYCQHVRVDEFKTGGVQLRQLGCRLAKGQPYEITLWLRGSLDVPVTVGFRKAEKPYSYYVKEAVKVSPAWQQFTIRGTAPEDDANAGLYLHFAGSGELWIDSVSAKATGATAEVASGAR